MMPSTRFEPENSSSGRRLCVQVWYSMFYTPFHLQDCLYWCIPEDESSGSKHVEDIN